MMKSLDTGFQAPDVFFYVGKSGKPVDGDVIIPYPATNSYPGEKLTAKTNAEIVLPLPDGWKFDDLAWLSVWCREFSVNFGDIYFKQKSKSGSGPGGSASAMSSFSMSVVILSSLLMVRFS